MKKAKWRLAVAAVVAVAFGGWLWRVIWLNANTPKAERCVYAMGERVPYGDDFIYSSREQYGEYAVTVKSATAMTLEAYAEKYQLTLVRDDSETFWPDNVIDLVAEFQRTGGEEDEETPMGGIDLFSTLLVADNLRLPVKWELFYAMYPHLNGTSGFALRPNTSMELHLPYAPERADDQIVANGKFLRTHTFYLDITLYPHKKQIAVKPIEG